MSRYLLIALLALATRSMAVTAKPMDDAEAAYKAGDYATVMRLIRPMAEQGYAPAQFMLGTMYQAGLETLQDSTQALVWYRKSADQGFAPAQDNLGLMYYIGQGVPQDYTKATKWFRKAADQGWAAAQDKLGLMYREGRGVPQNYAWAIMWDRKAADQGETHAQATLGLMYEFGKGVPQDYVQAHKWYNLAAARFAASDAGMRDVAVRGRDRVAAKMNPAQIAEAQRLAAEWTPMDQTSISTGQR